MNLISALLERGLKFSLVRTPDVSAAPTSAIFSGAGTPLKSKLRILIGGESLHSLVKTACFTPKVFTADVHIIGNIICRVVGPWSIAVSYTHLDVYKRQVLVK